MKSAGRKSEQTEVLFRRHEKNSNRTAALCLLIYGCYNLVMVLLTALGLYDLGLPICLWLLLADGILNLVLFFYAADGRYEGETTKYLLVAAVLTACGILFFFYPLNAKALTYLPVLFSALYYDIRFIRLTAALDGVLYSLLLWGNVLLEKVSPAIRAFHAYQ